MNPQAAYDELVPGFEALFAQVGGDWPRFHAAVRELARRPRDERQARLRSLGDTATADGGAGAVAEAARPPRTAE